jgi:anti-anti-sigma factor
MLAGSMGLTGGSDEARVGVRYQIPGAAMPEERFPSQWAGQQALVTLPQHIDRGNAGQIREQLLWIINRSAAVLIADLTGTLSCDYSGAEALGRAHHRAAANGTELRLVVTAAVVRRVLALNGLDRLVAVYPDLRGALAAGAGRRRVHGEHGTRLADHAARAEELLRLVTAGMADAGLVLQAAIGLPPDVNAQRITEALRRLDDAIRDVRDYLSAERGQDIEPELAWRPPRQLLERSARAINARSCCNGTWRKPRVRCIRPRPIPPRCWSGGLTFSASPGASTIRPRSSGCGPLPIRPGTWPNAGSSNRDLISPQHTGPIPPDRAETAQGPVLLKKEATGQSSSRSQNDTLASLSECPSLWQIDRA